MRSQKVTFDLMRHIVATSVKQRFELVPLNPAPAPSDSLPSSSSAGSLNSATSTLSVSPNSNHQPTAENTLDVVHDPAQHVIRATQGHSIRIASEALLSPVLPDDPSTPKLAVHGTTPFAWRSILKSGGLSRMSRTHVHFAPGTGGPGGDAPVSAPIGTNDVEKALAASTATTESDGGLIDASDETGGAKDRGGIQPAPDAAPVISGMRASSSILVWVAVKKSAEAALGHDPEAGEPGLKWWRSANGVLLTEGNARGRVSLKWVVCVEERDDQGKRTRIWEPKQPQEKEGKGIHDGIAGQEKASGKAGHEAHEGKVE